MSSLVKLLQETDKLSLDISRNKLISPSGILQILDAGVSVEFQNFHIVKKAEGAEPSMSPPRKAPPPLALPKAEPVEEKNQKAAALLGYLKTGGYLNQLELSRGGCDVISFIVDPKKNVLKVNNKVRVCVHVHPCECRNHSRTHTHTDH